MRKNEVVIKRLDVLPAHVAEALLMVGLRKVTVMEREIGPMWINNQTKRGSQ